MSDISSVKVSERTSPIEGLASRIIILSMYVQRDFFRSRFNSERIDLICLDAGKRTNELMGIEIIIRERKEKFIFWSSAELMTR